MAACQIDRRIAGQVEDQLKADGSIKYCFLVGNRRTIIDVCVCKSSSSVELAREYTDLCPCYPIGLDICGILFIGKDPKNAECVRKDWQNIQAQLSHILKHTQHFFIWPVDEQRNLDIANLYELNVSSEALEPSPAEWTDCDVTDHVTLRLRAHLKADYELDPKRDILEENIARAVDGLRLRVGSDIAVYHVEGSNLLLPRSTDDASQPTNNDLQVNDLYDHIQSEDDDGYGKKSNKSKKTKAVICVNLLFDSSSKRAVDKSVKCSPIIHYEHKNFKSASVRVPVDVLAVLRPDASVADLARMFSSKVQQQLQAFKTCLLKHSKGESVRQPRVHYFKPHDKKEHISIIYPDGISEENLTTYRQQLHTHFMLPKDRPFLRRTCQHVFSDGATQDGYLLNPHIGLSPSGVQGGEVHLVYGTYSYHHYMQDRFNDDKWGCAYRSLQTLVSWLRLQGYTDKPIPTHKDIQQVLVDIGDKESSFVGSRKWIGSTEVSYVLDTMFEIPCKILFVSSGEDMSNQGRELANHFDTQGTPIMIGGGVLAHTILGVDFNDVTGDLKFLILDPHYTGAEDLKVIQDKGWCGWKGIDFWNKTAYYNMCLPQRPKVI